jgi:hypothetical protein
MSDIGSGSPQFETVEYNATSGNCALCNQPIGSTYYRINGEQACAKCAERERAAQQDNAKNYSRALAFGVGAAIVGMIGYAAFEIITGWIIGYVALAVGWLVGKAMLAGSKGKGGRKYQITAAILTYTAVSVAAIPVMVYHIAKEKKQPSHAQVQPIAPAQQAPASQASGGEGEAPVTPATSSDPSAETTATTSPEPESRPAKAEEPKMGFAKAMGMLLLLGLASPFLELASPLHGIIGLFILFIGIQIAWKMMAKPKLQIDGPF